MGDAICGETQTGDEGEQSSIGSEGKSSVIQTCVVSSGDGGKGGWLVLGVEAHTVPSMGTCNAQSWGRSPRDPKGVSGGQSPAAHVTWTMSGNRE